MMHPHVSYLACPWNFYHIAASAPKSFTNEDCKGMAPIDYVVDTKAIDMVNKYIAQLVSSKKEKLMTLKDEISMVKLQGKDNHKKKVLVSILRKNTKYSEIQPAKYSALAA